MHGYCQGLIDLVLYCECSVNGRLIWMYSRLGEQPELMWLHLSSLEIQLLYKLWFNYKTPIPPASLFYPQDEAMEIIPHKGPTSTS